MKKTIFLILILLLSTNAYALHEHGNPDLYGNPITEELQSGATPGGYLQQGEGDAYGSITENPPIDEDSWWDKTIESVGDWWYEE